MGIRPNSAKHTQNENVPPSSGSSRVLNVKSVVSRVSRTSRTLRDVQIRKRSESGVQTTKHIVEQAKRRQTKNKIRFTVKSMPNKIKDVEMADGTSVQQPTVTVPIHLPQELMRPSEFKAVTPAMIAAVDNTYEDTNVQYFRDGLLVIEKE